MLDDQLTAGELAYLESGGENTAGLLAESGVGAVPSGMPPSGETSSSGAVDDDDGGGFEIEVPGRGRMVDYRALKAERGRVAELQKQLGDLGERHARSDERLRLLTETLQQPAPSAQGAEQEIDPFEEALPDRERDIFGYTAGLERRLNHVVRQIPKLSEGVEQFRRSREEQAFVDSYKRDAIEFARQQPQFVPAYIHLLTTRAAQLQMQGYSEQEIPDLVRREERGLIERARAQKKNPAEFLYSLARSFGFKPQQGQQPAPRGPAAGRMSLERLAALSDREFEAILAKHPGEIERMLGRAA